MEEHKSVIMHLLSQVRLGMDLTKVGSKSGLLFKSSRLHGYTGWVGGCSQNEHSHPAWVLLVSCFTVCR